MQVPGVTLVLLPPPQTADPIAATTQWLLGLWQVSKKSRLRLWRAYAPISLELISTPETTQYQLHFRDRTLSEASERLLRAYLPGVELEVAERDYLAETLIDSTGTIASLGLRRPGWVDVAPASASAMAGLLGAAAASGADAGVVVQLLIHPTWMSAGKGSEPAFWFSGRLVAFGGQVQLAEQRLRIAASGFGVFSSVNGVRVGTAKVLRKEARRALLERSWPRVFLPGGHVATAPQIASLFHPPEVAARTPQLAVASSTRAPAPRTTTGVILGEGRDPFGRPVPLRIETKDLLRHGVVLGPSGSGKSTLLAHLAVDLIGQGVGVTVIDPHGSLVREIARRLPRECWPSSSLLRFSDLEHPVSLNPLLSRPGHTSAAADELVDILQRVFGRSHWGPMLDLLLRHVALATSETGGSLLESARMLEDPDYRDEVLANVQAQETVRFLGALGNAGAFDRRILPALHRLQRVVASPLLRNIVGQAGSSLDFGALMDRDESLLCDLSGIGVPNARLLGSLLLLMLRQATLDRRLSPAERHPHIVLLDEASWFVGATVGELFDQARKFGVGVVLGLQRSGQLTPEGVRGAVLGNVGTTLLFRTHDRDEATVLHRHLATERITLSDLQHLPRYEAYVQLTRDGERHEPAWLRTAPPPPEPASANDAERVLLGSGLRRYTLPRPVVEAQRALRERQLHHDDPEIRSLSGDHDEIPADAA